MDKKLYIIGMAVLLVFVGLNGCTQQTSTEQANDNSGIDVNQPPTVSCWTASLYAKILTQVSFYCEAEDTDGSIVLYHWDFGDGNTTSSSGYGNTSHRFVEPGIYNITLSVTDNEGATASDNITMELEYYPLPEITVHTVYSNEESTYFYGEVKNNGESNINLAYVKITLYDASNNKIDIPYNNGLTYARGIFNTIIEPQGTAVFSYVFSTPYYDHYDIKIESFETTDEQPYEGLIITDENIIKKSSYAQLGATIKNSGSKIVNSLSIYVSFYNSNGKIIYIEWYSTNLGPLYSGQENSFDVYVTPDELEGEPTDIESYKFHISYSLT